MVDPRRATNGAGLGWLYRGGGKGPQNGPWGRQGPNHKPGQLLTYNIRQLQTEVEEVMTEPDVKPSQVVTFIGENRRERIVFNGLREDAARYIVEHFPRLHVEPGSPDTPVPDAILIDENGAMTFWNGVEWLEYKEREAVSARAAAAQQDKAKDDEIAQLRAQLAEFQQQQQSVTEPPVTEPPVTEPPVTEPVL